MYIIYISTSSDLRGALIHISYICIYTWSHTTTLLPTYIYYIYIFLTSPLRLFTLISSIKHIPSYAFSLYIYFVYIDIFYHYCIFYLSHNIIITFSPIGVSSGSSRQLQHLPYRDSKLTRIMQPSLSGNALIVVICTISPTVRSLSLLSLSLSISHTHTHSLSLIDVPRNLTIH